MGVLTCAHEPDKQKAQTHHRQTRAFISNVSRAGRFSVVIVSTAARAA